MSLIQAKIKSKLTGAVMSVIPVPTPEIFTGQGCLRTLGKFCKEQLKVKKVLIVTDEIIPTLGLLDSTYESLKENSIQFVVFDKVTPDPTVETCILGQKVYSDNKCEAIIAFGGGSSMDCAKMVAILATNPKADPKSFAGTFQVGFFVNVPPLIAVPTTAGTGSETTLAAIISWPSEQRKYVIMDTKIVPPFAFLDPMLLQKLPKGITAATGMDALTHAVESYVGPWRTEYTAECALRAIKNTFDYLPTCYRNGDDLKAREKMLIASFDAGLAFTRAGVGYVHAIAHQLGALFHIPHGVANAMLLHHVLDFYRTAPTNVFALDSLAKMALVVDNRGHETVKAAQRQQLADQFVEVVRCITRDLEIPTFAKGLGPDRLVEVADRALKEAHGQSFDLAKNPLKAMLDSGYPVPKYMNMDDCLTILKKIVDPSARSSSSKL